MRWHRAARWADGARLRAGRSPLGAGSALRAGPPLGAGPPPLPAGRSSPRSGRWLLRIGLPAAVLGMALASPARAQPTDPAAESAENPEPQRLPPRAGRGPCSRSRRAVSRHPAAHGAGAAHRRPARRGSVEVGRYRRRLRAAGAVRGGARHRAHRRPAALRRARPLHRCRGLRLAPRGGDRDRDAPRLAAPLRRGQLPGHPRHLSRPALRLHVRHQPPRREARATGGRGGRGRFPGFQQPQRQRELGRRLGCPGPAHGGRLGGGDRHSDGHPPLPRRRAAGLGRQLHAQHPAQERAGLLGAHLEGIHADAREPRGNDDRHPGREPRSRPAPDAVRPGGRPAGPCGGRARRVGVRGLRPGRQVRRGFRP